MDRSSAVLIPISHFEEAINFPVSDQKHRMMLCPVDNIFNINTFIIIHVKNLDSEVFFLFFSTIRFQELSELLLLLSQ